MINVLVKEKGIFIEHVLFVDNEFSHRYFVFLANLKYKDPDIENYALEEMENWFSTIKELDAQEGVELRIGSPSFKKVATMHKFPFIFVPSSETKITIFEGNKVVKVSNKKNIFDEDKILKLLEKEQRVLYCIPREVYSLENVIFYNDTIENIESSYPIKLLLRVSVAKGLDLNSLF